jgi:hypothetical protein
MSPNIGFGTANRMSRTVLSNPHIKGEQTDDHLQRHIGNASVRLDDVGEGEEITAMVDGKLRKYTKREGKLYYSEYTSVD